MPDYVIKIYDIIKNLFKESDLVPQRYKLNWAQITLKDVVKVIRDDEAGHRDVNHSFANVIDERKTKETNNTKEKQITTKENLGGNN